MHIHFLGICGTFMGSLALLAKAKGFKVTGQDQNVYPPMSDALKQADILIHPDYETTHYLHQCDQIIVGNALSRGNPCIEVLLDHSLNYCSGPEWLQHHILPGRHIIAIAGTHGKTTTTSLMAWILDQQGLNPGFLIGGICQAWPVSARLGSGDYFVVEADEYDTAFFDKAAKFLHYRPRDLIVNNLEFDHADIYNDLAAIETQFHRLIRTLPTSGHLVIPNSQASLRRVLEQGSWSQVIIGDDQGYQVQPDITRQQNATRQQESCAQLIHNGRVIGHITGPLSLGSHNHQNALSAILMSLQLGLPLDATLEAISKFPGVKRRLEHLGCHQQIDVFDDFAHHPSAISKTIQALKAQYPNRRLIAAIELGSNTMKQGIHNHQLVQATQKADAVFWLCPPDKAIQSSLSPELPKTQSAVSDKRAVSDNSAFSDIHTLQERLLNSLKPEDVLLFMSNKGFYNLQQRCINALNTQC